jgi:sensitive to high expression protein 9
MPEEERINVARQAARKAKAAYEEAVVQRSNSQREVNDLLQRKNTWVDNDVVRFTNLVRQDHLYEQEESRAKASVNETEDGVEREFSQLLRTILARYHEEQVWSDKIRSASTYGSLAALGLNMFVFILAILLVEPWKRRRLAQTFERKIEELSAENETRLDASMQAITQQIAQQSALLEALKEEITINVQESFPGTVAAAQEDSQGEDRSDVQVLSWVPSQRQLEMAAFGAGAFVVGILSTVLFSR